METIFNILTVLVFWIIFTTQLALTTLSFIVKKNWKKLNISLSCGVLKFKIEE